MNEQNYFEQFRGDGPPLPDQWLLTEQQTEMLYKGLLITDSDTYHRYINGDLELVTSDGRSWRNH